MNKLSYPFVLLCIGLYLSMPAASEIEIVDGYVRGLPPGQPVTAAFMKLINTGNGEVEILAASTDSSERAEIHAHVHRNGMMGMEKVESIVIPANSEFVLAPGEHHLMLINLTRPLVDGDKVAVEFKTNDNQFVRAVLPVISVLNERQHH